MMIFSVYDSKARAFMQPFFSPTAGTALRAFKAAANDSEHAFFRHAGDYTLFEIAEWKEQEGVIDMYETTINLGLAITMVEKDERSLAVVQGGYVDLEVKDADV